MGDDTEPSWMPDDAIERVRHILNAPGYRRDPLPASTVAALLGVTVAAVSNLPARPWTGVHRYPGGYDLWEVQLWFLTRNQAQAARAAKRRRTPVVAPVNTGV